MRNEKASIITVTLSDIPSSHDLVAVGAQVNRVLTVLHAVWQNGARPHTGKAQCNSAEVSSTPRRLGSSSYHLILAILTYDSSWEAIIQALVTTFHSANLRWGAATTNQNDLSDWDLLVWLDHLCVLDLALLLLLGGVV